MQASTATPAAHVTVLLAEDDEAFRELLVETLRAAGFDTLSAASGEEALRIAASNPVDLLLTDVVMDGMNGLELAQRMRSEVRRLPVLFMSGYSERSLSDAALLPAGSRLLHKPFDAGELKRRIEEALAVVGPARPRA